MAKKHKVMLRMLLEGKQLHEQFIILLQMRGANLITQKQLRKNLLSVAGCE